MAATFDLPPAIATVSWRPMSSADIERVRAERPVSITRPCFENMSENFRDTASAARLFELVLLRHAGREHRSVRLHPADADEAQRRLDAHFEDGTHAALLEENGAVLDRVGVEGQGKHVGFRAGAFARR